MKQTKAMIEKQKERRNLRREMVDAVKRFRSDVDAAKRYLSTKGEKLTEDEEQRMFERYEVLKGYKLRYDREDRLSSTWNILSNIVDNKRGYNDEPSDKYFTEKLGEDDLRTNCTLWGSDDVELLIKEARKYGYTRLFIDDNSTLSMNTVALILELGGKIEKPFYNTDTDEFGLIINIEEAKPLDSYYIENEEVTKDMTEQIESLGDSAYRYFGRQQVKCNLLEKYSKEYGIIKTYHTLEKVIDDVRSK